MLLLATFPVQWAKHPLSKTSAALARRWLLKARRRKTYRKHIQPQIDNQNKEAEVCDICQRNTKSGAKMRVDLAKDNRASQTVFDELIQGFENSNSQDAWDDPSE